jgi:3-hydroxybutyryl-CoA dehydrogenase
MGCGIAEICGRAGLSVILCEQDEGQADGARERIRSSLDRAVRREKIVSSTGERALSNISFTSNLGCLNDRDLIVEAITEDLREKRAVFAGLDKVVSSEAILATNTSSIPIADIAVASSHPERVLGTHFFNPVPVMRLVEVIPTLLTATDVTSSVEGFVGDILGKHVVRVRDRAGFLVNSLLVPMLLNAVRLLESGVASASAIDEALVLAFDHPMGPLHLCDLIGVDTVIAMADSLHAEYGEPAYCPPPMLRRMQQAGFLGRKSGVGFFDYER